MANQWKKFSLSEEVFFKLKRVKNEWYGNMLAQRYDVNAIDYVHMDVGKLILERKKELNVLFADLNSQSSASQNGEIKFSQTFRIKRFSSACKKGNTGKQTRMLDAFVSGGENSGTFIFLSK